MLLKEKIVCINELVNKVKVEEFSVKEKVE